MADGSTKPIDQVTVGDTVSNAVPDSGTIEHHTVTAVHVTTTDRSFDDLTFDTPVQPVQPSAPPGVRPASVHVP
jgi:hypothetical protein